MALGAEIPAATDEMTRNVLFELGEIPAVFGGDNATKERFWVP